MVATSKLFNTSLCVEVVYVIAIVSYVAPSILFYTSHCVWK